MTKPDARPIVVAVPSDDDIDSTLHYAAAEARTHGCGLRLVHAHAPGCGERADQVLRRAAAVARLLAGPSVRITTRRVTGVPVEAVLTDSRDARLVVLRGRDSLHLLRTLASGTIGSGATSPVACVPAHWAPRVRDPRPVLLGVEDPMRPAALGTALQIARAHRTSLRVMHAWHFPGPSDGLVDRQVGPELSASFAASLRCALAESQQADRSREVSVEVHVVHGTAAEALLQAAGDAQVLLLGRNRPAPDGSLRLGRTSRAALHESPCPVVLLPPESSAPADSALAGAVGAVVPGHFGAPAERCVP